jgi:TRAP transporter 4TM/12TM fusion protein
MIWLTSAIAVYHLALVGQLPAWFGYFIPHQVHKAVSICCALLLIFWLLPSRGKKHGEDTEARATGRRVPWYDYVLLASGLIGAGFVIFDNEAVLDYGFYGFLDTRGLVFSLMLAVPLLEAVRRTTGLVLPLIILFFAGITVFQPYLPGLLYGDGYPIDRLMYSAYVGDAGIFGLPLGIAANIVIVFLIFGALMDKAAASRWFMDLALAVTGRSRGGPAKAAVVASALFGSISGSPSGNAATTGVFTIPLMKKVGYTPAFAAGVEAVAATGGMILPPVMGAIVFIMAEWIRVRYVDIVMAAAVPAILYYLIIFFSVHFQAGKDGIVPMAREEIPHFGKVLKAGWYYLIPLVALIYFLVIEALPPGLAGVYSCGAVLLTSFISRDRSHWLTPWRIMEAFQDGVGRWVVIAAITASVGIMIGALELSGVGIKFSRFILELSQGNLYLTLLLVGVVSLVVGMGLDATPAYITLATLMAPALIQLDVSPMAAHLYVIYWGLASFFTPPTCIAVFVTCSLAGSKVWATGWEAVKLGIAAFLVPIAFVINPGLLLSGRLPDIALATSTALIGAVLLASGIRGYAFDHLNGVQRLLLIASGILFILPGIVLPLAGLILALLALLPAHLQRRGGLAATAGKSAG